MKAHVWGCRGSVATPGPENVGYGGNTSCVEVRTESGDVIVLDAGTGLRPLGVDLQQHDVDEVHLLLSHLHLDHLQGLGFFRALFDPNMTVHIWGPPSPVQSLEDRIALYLAPPLFPVRLSDIPATVVFHDAPDEAITIGSVEVVASAVTHQGPTVGYRITEAGRSLTYLPDHEPSLGVNLEDLDGEWISGYDLAQGTDVLLHDAQYGDGEYPAHVGWGHSAIAHVVEFARKADVGRLVLFHHDPYHDDRALDALLIEAELLMGAEASVAMASEGMQIEI
jgi:phosphoribosyl 1,2-cyclic phosphodiesterase